MAATINAVEQGQCTECETDVVENYSTVQRIVADTGIWRHVTCECGAEAVVRIHEDGLSVGGPISHEQASWNQQRK